MVDYIPEQKDIVWINFNPTKGHEQKGKRPALVVSASDYNERAGLFLVCPITKKKKGYPFEVEVNGKEVEGVVLSDQVCSLDWKERKVSFAQKVKENIFRKVKENTSVLIN